MVKVLVERTVCSTVHRVHVTAILIVAGECALNKVAGITTVIRQDARLLEDAHGTNMIRDVTREVAGMDKTVQHARQ